MPCKDAMITDVISVTREHTVSDVLQLFYNKHIRNVPVLNDDGTLAGVISFKRLLAHLLPASATMEKDLKRFKHLNVNLDHLAGQSPWVTRRLKQLPFRFMNLFTSKTITLFCLATLCNTSSEMNFDVTRIRSIFTS